MMVNRGRLEIMAQILGLCTKPKPKTRIMYNVNITFNQFGTYATLLESQGLLTREENRYMTTAKGLQFINAFSQLQNILGRSDSRMSLSHSIEARQELKKPPVTIYVQN